MPLPRFWEFAHLSTDFHTQRMGWVDPIPRCGNISIGGLHALYQQSSVFAQNNITHILSVLDFDIDPTTLKPYTHLHIPLEDEPNSNLLQHFQRSNEFISSALESGGGVFVHCAMGKSRSATMVCAYLMWKYRLSAETALAQVCEGRPVCSPNLGFMEQLRVWGRMLEVQRKGDEGKSREVYETWLRERFVGESWEWEKRAKGAKL